MKFLSILLVLVFCFVVSCTSLALATETQGTDWRTPCGPANSILNQHAGHVHEYDRLEAEWGVRAGQSYWPTKNHEINTEGFYDFNNEDHYGGYATYTFHWGAGVDRRE